MEHETSGCIIGSIDTNRGRVLDVAFHPQDPNVIVALTYDDAGGKLKRFSIEKRRVKSNCSFMVGTQAPRALFVSVELVGAAAGRAIKLWNLSKRSSVMSVLDADDVISLRYSSDHRILFSGLRSGSVSVWSVDTKSLLCSTSCHNHAISSLCLASDLSFVLTASADMKLKKLWLDDHYKLTLARTFSGHEGAVTAIALSPTDDNLAATASGDKSVRLWQLNSNVSGSNEECWVLEGHTQWVSCVLFSANGSALVSASFDCEVRLWSVSSGSCLYVLQAHTGFVVSAAMSPEGTALATVSQDGAAKLWNVRQLLSSEIIREFDVLPYPVPAVDRFSGPTGPLRNIMEKIEPILLRITRAFRSMFVRIRGSKVWPVRIRQRTMDVFRSFREDASHSNDLRTETDSGDESATLREFDSSAHPTSTSSRSNSEEGKEGKAIPVGTLVEANYLYSGTFEPGRVMQHNKDNETYAIKFLIGEMQKGVPRRDVRILDGKGSKADKMVLKLTQEHDGDDRGLANRGGVDVDEKYDGRSFVLKLMATRVGGS